MSGQKLYKDRDWLEEQYVEKGLNRTEIAKKTDCSYRTIARNLHKFDIVEPSGNWERITCDQCEEVFQKKKSEIGHINFCSKSCSQKFHQKRQIVTCTNCGEKFEKIESEIRDQNFCSRECYLEFSSEQGNTTVCDWCGKEFHKPPKEMKKHNFCCHEHYSKWLSENNVGKSHPNYDRKQVECTYCGTEFLVEKNHFERRENFFCSPECYAKHLADGWVWGICEQCGQRFLKSVYRYKLFDHHFCSQKCSEKFHVGEKAGAWKGGYEPYYGGPIWERQRRKALKRDNYTCQECGAEENLVVHHKTPVRVFKQGKSNEEVNWEKVNKLSNLQTLCRSCHRKVGSSQNAR